ncbi:MAG: hypothetical protein A2Y10_08455 [Planctomycetes bacterium GWF2_41_51]|nr:MAG: hypothetical protein A2Y10_08455 [Planctomycetes bacterium GWF2_41_51]HBG27068.1 hypothetical protein [Phycisphaerales bacterium]
MSRTKTRRSVTKPVTKSKSTSKRTTDHKEIMKWAENRGGQPAAVKRTRGSKETGLIRIDFPGYSGSKSLEHISWDDFFKKFDKSKLQLVYQDKTKDGKKSRFNRLVKIKK